MNVQSVRMAALCALVVACSAAEGPTPDVTGEPTGSLELPLVTESSNGTIYRLRDATFELDGPRYYTIDTREDLSLGDSQRIALDVPAGGYEVRLLPGWRLVRVESDNSESDVLAQLTSSNPQLLTVTEATTSPVTFSFHASTIGDLTLGGVNIGITVTDEPNALEVLWSGGNRLLSAIVDETVVVQPATDLGIPGTGSFVVTPSGVAYTVTGTDRLIRREDGASTTIHVGDRIEELAYDDVRGILYFDNRGRLYAWHEATESVVLLGAPVTKGVTTLAYDSATDTLAWAGLVGDSDVESLAIQRNVSTSTWAPELVASTTDLVRVLQAGDGAVRYVDAGQLWMYEIATGLISSIDTVGVASPVALAFDHDTQAAFYLDAAGVLYRQPIGGAAIALLAGPVTPGSDLQLRSIAIPCGASPEVCNGADDDCDGNVDEGVLVTYYRDQDSDTYGVLGAVVQGCSRPTGWALVAGDCNDANPAVRPGANETCDGVDNDCDASIDEGVGTTYFRDQDSDGFGSGTTTVVSCSASTGYVTNNSDCNDANPSVRPSQTSYFTTATSGGYDYNCDGAASPRDTALQSCPFFACTQGWTGSVPACGQTGTWGLCTGLFGGCGGSEARVQACR